jgi:dihydroflavonol-4-reductase
MPIALVTGASGFIGGHLARRLVAEGWEVRALVRATSDLAGLKGVDARLYLGDLRDPQSLAEACRGVDAVFHTAGALMATSRAEFVEVNAGGTRNLLETVLAESPNVTRVVVLSSQAAAGPSPADRDIDEATPPAPISWYGQSKAETEEACRDFAADLPITVLRPVAVYGPRERDLSGTWPVLANRIHPHVGFGRRYLMAIHVDELVDLMLIAARTKVPSASVYFAGHPEKVTAWQLVRAVARAMNRPLGLPLPVPVAALRMSAPFAELAHHFTGARPAVTRDKVREIAQRRWTASLGKATRDFGWTSRTDLATGLARTVPLWIEEQRRIRAFTGEPPFLGWLKTCLVTMAIGIVIEVTSAIGGFYAFEPRWGVFPILVGAFGVGLGSVTWFARRWAWPLRYLAGAVAATALELLVAADMLPFLDWTFKEGWPLGITDDYVRAFLLGQAGGVFVLLGGAIRRSLYLRRQRTG